MIHEFTMSNGLKVIGIESHKSPVVSVQMWVRNGSADERQGDEGLSHFIEHLVFKGSRKYKMGEIAALVESCGGELNAYTSFDQTVFYVTISKNFYTTALDVVSEMVGYPEFNGEEIDKEREVVIEEIKRSHDSLGRRASRVLFTSMYKDYPYSVPVIGYDEIIKNVSHDRIRSFFQERYVPRNMFLVVTGNFDPDTFKSNVERYFGDFKDREVKLPVRPEVPPLVNRYVEVEEAKFEESIFYLSWPTVNIEHPDVPALETLSLILGQGGSSRLTRQLRLVDPCVNYIGAGTWSPSTRGFFAITGAVNPENYERALVGIKGEIEKLLKDGVSEEELLKAKTNFLSDEAYSLETVGGLARKYGSNFDLTKNIYFHEEFFKNLAKVTCQDVIRVAQKYLDPQTTTAVAIVPSGKEKVKKLLEEWTFDNSTTAKVSDKPIEGPQFKQKVGKGNEEPLEYTLSSGAKVLTRLNMSSPVFNMRMASLSGSRVLPKEKAGLTELTKRIWSSETQKTDENTLRAKIDSLASSIHSFTGRNTVGLVVDGLSDYQHLLADTFSEILIDRKFSESILNRERQMVYETLRSRRDNPAQVASLLFQENLFGDHPYAIDTLGTEETLKKIVPAEIEAYLQEYLRPESMVFSLSGDFDEELWLSKLEEATARLKPGKAIIEKRDHKDIKENIEVFEKAEKEQTNIIYGFKGLSLSDPDRFVLQMIEAILAGQGGRLFIELRDKASLAYSVSPLRLEGLETGYFAAYIGCSPEKSKTAITMMRDEFDKLMNDPVSDKEIARAKNYLMGHHDIHLQKNSAISSSMLFNEIYGLSQEEIFNYKKFIQGIAAKDVQRVAQKIFGQKHVISAVGPDNFFTQLS